MGFFRTRAAAFSAVAGAALAAIGIAAAAGEPDRGARVWLDNGCGVCHTLKRAGSTGSSGPNIDRWLVPHAVRAKTTVERFALSRVVWGGRGMVAYGPHLSAEEVDDVVAFVLGRPFARPAGDVVRMPAFDVPPPLVRASRTTVARWVRALRLRGDAARGATLFAREGCLSCHRYRGSGVRKLAAPELTGIGRSHTARYLRLYTARPYRYGNTNMPTYVDVGEDNLRRIAAFLDASA